MFYFFIWICICTVRATVYMNGNEFLSCTLQQINKALFLLLLLQFYFMLHSLISEFIFHSILSCKFMF